MIAAARGQRDVPLARCLMSLLSQTRRAGGTSDRWRRCRRRCGRTASPPGPPNSRATKLSAMRYVCASQRQLRSPS